MRLILSQKKKKKNYITRIKGKEGPKNIGYGHTPYF